MNKWIAEFDLEDGDTMPEHMDLNYEKGIIDFHCRPMWISCSERLPSHDEYVKNNGLFNVTDGNRSYSEWFDIYDMQKFGEPTISGFRIDHAVIAWAPLPDPYKL